MVKFAKNLKIDLFINTRSMMEMNFKVLEYYFKQIHVNITTKGYFLNVNRYTKKTYGEAINIAEYPYDDKWDVVVSKKSFLQDHIHFLLSKRTTKIKGNLSKEIMLLRKETTKYIASEKKMYFKKFLVKIFVFILPKKLKNFLKKYLIEEIKEQGKHLNI